MKPKLLFITVLMFLLSANVLSAADKLSQITTIDLSENDAAFENANQPVFTRTATQLAPAVTTSTSISTTIPGTRAITTTSAVTTTITTSTTTTTKDIIASPEAEISKTDIPEAVKEEEEPQSIMKWFSRSKTLSIVGQPLAYPNPMRGKGVTFQYTLSKDANIEIYIFSPSAEIVQKISCVSGQQGGAEQINKVYWDGRTNRGRITANGIYWVNIVSKDDGAAIGKIRLTVFN